MNCLIIALDQCCGASRTCERMRNSSTHCTAANDDNVFERRSADTFQMGWCACATFGEKYMTKCATFVSISQLKKGGTLSL